MSFDSSLYGLNNQGSGNNPFIIGRVTKIILEGIDINDLSNKDFADLGEWGAIGCIQFSVLYSNKQSNNESYANLIAKPLFSNIKQYPLIGEIVQIVPGPSDGINDRKSKQDYYYYPPFNTWNSVHHNAFPDLREYSEFIIDNKVNYNQVAEGNTQGLDSNTSIEYPLGKTFKEKEVRDLLPFEGDFILEGRWGQSIRFGSTIKQKSDLNFWSKTDSKDNGDPVTIISNYRNKKASDPKEPYVPTIEDINNDGSMICLSHNQQIEIKDLQLYPLASFGAKIKTTQDNVITLQPIYKSNYKTSPKEQDNKDLNI
jgi:hypothetical protein